MLYTYTGYIEADRLKNYLEMREVPCLPEKN